MNKLNLIFVYTVFLALAFPAFSQNIFKDLTDDHTLTITINKSSKDATGDINDSSDDLTFGNKWYSKRKFFINNSTDIGLSGSKDYLEECFLFKFSFRSRNRHSFTIRTNHTGFVQGLFSGNFKFYDFGITGGFEYLYKIFGSNSGFFVWTDIGACQKGPAFNIGIGIGSDSENGFQLYFSYLHNILISSKMQFYLLLFKYFTLKGKLGISVHLTDFVSDFFNFYNGFYMGFFIKKIFKLELGGGFTFNDYGFFSGFGGIEFLIQF